MMNSWKRKRVKSPPEAKNGDLDLLVKHALLC